MPSFFLTVKFLVILRVLPLFATGVECGLYLAPSTVMGAGRGIIAGQPYEKLDLIEIVQTIPFRHDDCGWCQLNNYGYGTDDVVYSMIMLGAGVLYNHNEPKNVEYNWVSSSVADPSDNVTPYSKFTKILFSTTTAINAGQEIFVHYGDDWLSDRGMANNLNGQCVVDLSTDEVSICSPNAAVISIVELEQYGHCLSHVEIRESHLRDAGAGLFAKRPFTAGEVVVVAPVLVLDAEVARHIGEQSVLPNYCITSPDFDSQVVLLPVTNAAMVNHQPEELSNLDMVWYDWSAIPSEGSYYEHLGGNALNLSAKLSQSPQVITAASFAQLDIAYVARRDIAEGEELTCNYGARWAADWEKYLTDLAAIDSTTQEVAVFRSFLEAPSGMFPSHWAKPDEMSGEV